MIELLARLSDDNNNINELCDIVANKDIINIKWLIDILKGELNKIKDVNESQKISTYINELEKIRSQEKIDIQNDENSTTELEKLLFTV